VISNLQFEISDLKFKAALDSLHAAFFLVAGMNHRDTEAQREGEEVVTTKYQESHENRRSVI
jgi:hypothetical protein